MSGSIFRTAIDFQSITQRPNRKEGMMEVQKILLPYNFTRNDQKALDFVIDNFCGYDSVEITLFNAYTPPPDLEVRGSPIMEKMKGNVGYLSQKISEQKEELEAVAGRLIGSGLVADKVHTIFRPKKKDSAGDIIDMAVAGRFQVVVLNRKAGGVTRFFTGSVFNKVVTALKGKTVCVVC
jgi:hypothetical protein